MASRVLRSAGIGNSNTGATFLFHETGNQLRVYFGIYSDSCLGNMPPINFRVELKACFCWIKWLTSNIRHNRNNFHLTWESTFLLVHGHRTAWTVFSRPVGVTIRGNLIGLPLLRVVNNSDRWMRKAWEWREASQVVRTCFGTRLWPVGHRLFRSPNSTTITQVMLSIGPNQ